ncbi:alpha/beta fold hydrolase [Virgibacillus litoralis]|uniref:Proline iminopeptidase n=1 Tax=Virgibacillus litoralis TaxID=578221 RepID=A0ABS4HJ86_9BACI|nr:alpha/beta fold hydrolase [Virgibacillus litoralis]MBP1950878.1 proline-specific peptidase [Virgibacillus litoralis]
MNINNENLVSAKITQGYIKSENYKTFYEVHTPNYFNSESTPIILLAGGPGLSFKTLTPLLNLAETRPIIAYDQIGSGKSTRSEQLTSLNIEDFMEQFNNVVSELGATKFHILGHSWGTILGVNIALEYPGNIQSLILQSGIADWKKCLEARRKFELEYYPEDLKKTIKKLNEGIKVSPDEVEDATNKFNNQFYCRAKYPKYLCDALNDKDLGTNQLIWNPEKNKEMANYKICNRLDEIKCPTFIISGKYDGISVGQGELFSSGIKNSTHVEFKNSSHYAHIEEEIAYLEQVKNFLEVNSN